MSEHGHGTPPAQPQTAADFAALAREHIAEAARCWLLSLDHHDAPDVLAWAEPGWQDRIPPALSRLLSEVSAAAAEAARNITTPGHGTPAAASR